MSTKPNWMTDEVATYFADLRKAKPAIHFMVCAYDGKRIDVSPLRETPLREIIAECATRDEANQKAVDFRDRCFVIDLDDLTVTETWADR